MNTEVGEVRINLMTLDSFAIEQAQSKVDSLIAESNNRPMGEMIVERYEEIAGTPMPKFLTLLSIEKQSTLVILKYRKVV